MMATMVLVGACTSFWEGQIVAPGQNFTGFDNKDASDWLEAARVTSDRNVRFGGHRAAVFHSDRRNHELHDRSLVP